MPKLFQYGKMASNQTSSVMTRPTAGLNEYLPSNTINDTLMSNVIDVYPYRDECVKFYADNDITQLGASTTAGKGLVRACINSDESTSNVDVFYLMTSLAAGWKIIRHTYTHTTAVTALTEFAMTMASIPANAEIRDSSSAIFKVEDETYYCFSNNHEKRLHFVKHTSTANTYGYVDLPAYPKKIVAHANRIFFIDIHNKLWWCRGGDLYSWYAMEYDDNAIVTTRNCANAAYTIAAQPNTTRQLTATVTRVSTIDTLGILTIVGTNGLGKAQTEVLTLAEGLVQGSMAFKTITSITQSGWTIGGTTADTIVVGWAPVGLGYVTDDAGFWTLEQELILHDVCILGGAMYIFCNHDIYVFQGYSPDSFSLTKLIADVGITRMLNPNGYQKLTTGYNVAYFIYDGSVYEFDGNNHPRIISRPVQVNNQTTNGVMGGVTFSGDAWVLAATAESLCLYNYSADYGYYYLYNFETKTWWKMSGILKGDIGATDEIKIAYVSSFDRQKFYTFLSIFSTANDYVLSNDQGCTQTGVLPFITTKAFNTNPSETGSLTEIILLLKGSSSDPADIKIQYSLTVHSDDFVDIRAYEQYVFNNDLETLSIPVPTSSIANAHHYRLKIIIGTTSGTSTVYLYNIERRFRMKGRSR